MTLTISLAGCAGASLESATSSATASPGPSASGPSASTGTASQPAEPGESASTAPADGDITTVTIRGQSFGTPEIWVAVGDVTFVNGDDYAHTISEGENGVTASGARFDLVIGAGETVQVPFDEPGDYRITCLFHAEMHLLVHAH